MATQIRRNLDLFVTGDIALDDPHHDAAGNPYSPDIRGRGTTPQTGTSPP